MKEIFVYIFSIIFFMVVVCGIGWVAAGNYFQLFSYFAPKYADVQRKVFENTAPYNEGMAEDLNRMKEEYILASKENKIALRTQILNQFASYDVRRLPPDLQEFINQLRGE